MKQKRIVFNTLSGLVLCSVNVVIQAATDENEPTTDAPFTLKIITNGEDNNRSDNMSEPSRQDNRRTDVKIKTHEQTGTRTVSEETSEQVKVKVSEAINRSIRLNDGGVIWVTKDPLLYLQL